VDLVEFSNRDQGLNVSKKISERIKLFSCSVSSISFLRTGEHTSYDASLTAPALFRLVRSPADRTKRSNSAHKSSLQTFSSKSMQELFQCISDKVTFEWAKQTYAMFRKLSTGASRKACYSDVHIFSEFFRFYFECLIGLNVHLLDIQPASYKVNETTYIATHRATQKMFPCILLNTHHIKKSFEIKVYILCCATMDHHMVIRFLKTLVSLSII
jgi:hypothetical protein